MSRNIEWIYSDLILKDSFKKYEFSYFFSKTLIANRYINIRAKSSAYVFILRSMRKNSITKQRCKSRIEGRARSVNTFTGLSRFPLRFLAGDGFFKGVVRWGR